MIRPTTNRKGIPTEWNRWRVSNLLAVVAAVMLFASTQVAPTPVIEVTAQTPSIEVIEGPESSSSATESTSNADSFNAERNEALAGATRKTRGLKLSLFKFRR